MRIFYVGNESIPAPLRELGHEVVSAFDTWPEVKRLGRPFDVRLLWEKLEGGADLLLVVDTLGRQTLPYGMEDIPIPRVYWAIDVHLNLFWQKHYGQLFDLVLVAQKDYLPLVEDAGVPAEWLPWGADETVFYDRGLERVNQLCFVGTVDPAMRPKRSAALKLLKDRFGMVTFGETVQERLSWQRMAEVFCASKIVFNETIMGELNFRVFEAMGCGAMLLTEEIDNGLKELFTPGVHLDVYTPATLLEKVEHYLTAEDEREKIARAGAEELRRHHTLKSRVSTLVEIVESGVSRREVASSAHYAWGMTAHLTVVRDLAEPAAAVPLAVASLGKAVDGLAAEAGVALGRIFAWAGKNDEALVVLERAREADESNTLAWFVAAEIAYTSGRAEEARRLFKGGVAAAPSGTSTTRKRALEALDGDVRCASCLNLLGLVLQEAGQPFVAGLVPIVAAKLPWSAYDYYQQAILTDPTNLAATENMASVLDFMAMGGFAACFREAAARCRPWDVGARELLCKSLLAAYRLTDADRQRRVIACLKQEAPCGTMAEKVAAYREAAQALQRAARRDQAVAVLEQAIASGLEDAELLKDCALICLDRGDYRSARRWLERVVAYADATRDEISTLFQLLERLEQEQAEEA